ncbi:MAG TPA: endonuclease/exonuclease/phosphatase family protein [Acidimicrobiales bacterium]|nr:endonuclease/exonuclease/phosphatase family protein [Acidimicrobiales bacterium]
MSDDRPVSGGGATAPGYRLRLVAWNTFLLRPRLIPGRMPLPAVGEMAAPAVADRAVAIGRALAGAYEVSALTEVFDPIERRSVLGGWDDRPGVTAVAGPERSFPPRGPAAFASSGLFTVADGVPLTRTDRLRYQARGDRPHDADAWSNKGVLLVEVDPLGGAGKLEIYSTHLLYGTGLLPGRRAADPERRHRVRMQQVDELVAFVERAHRPENLIVVVGDFNVPAHDAAQGLRPERWHLDLTSRMARLGLVDTWVERGVGPGPTYGRPEDAFDDEDPDCPGRLVDDPEAPGAVPGRQRIDYIWVQSPAPEHRLEVAFGQPRRRAFPRPADAPDHARLPRLSDHLAVELELTVRPRPQPPATPGR